MSSELGIGKESLEAGDSKSFCRFASGGWLRGGQGWLGKLELEFDAQPIAE